MEQTGCEILEVEFIVSNDEHLFAGTVDVKYRIGNKIYIADWKTSGNIYDTHGIQCAAYFHAIDFQCDGATVIRLDKTCARWDAKRDAEVVDVVVGYRKFLRALEQHRDKASVFIKPPKPAKMPTRNQLKS